MPPFTLRRLCLLCFIAPLRHYAAIVMNIYGEQQAGGGHASALCRAAVDIVTPLRAHTLLLIRYADEMDIRHASRYGAIHDCYATPLRCH